MNEALKIAVIVIALVVFIFLVSLDPRIDSYFHPLNAISNDTDTATLNEGHVIADELYTVIIDTATLKATVYRNIETIKWSKEFTDGVVEGVEE